MSNFRRLYDLCNDPDRLREFAKHPVGTREQLRISWMELETNCIPLPGERDEQMAERLCGFINHQLLAYMDYCGVEMDFVAFVKDHSIVIVSDEKNDVELPIDMILLWALSDLSREGYQFSRFSKRS